MLKKTKQGKFQPAPTTKAYNSDKVRRQKFAWVHYIRS